MKGTKSACLAVPTFVLSPMAANAIPITLTFTATNFVALALQ